MNKERAINILLKFAKDTCEAIDIRKEAGYQEEVADDLTAAIIFKKSSGKLALAIAFWKNNQGGHWDYFFPTDSHILGFQKIAPILEEIENYNFDKNG